MKVPTFQFEPFDDFAVATIYLLDKDSVRFETVWAKKHFEFNEENVPTWTGECDLIDIDGNAVEEFGDAEPVLMGRLFFVDGKLRKSLFIEGVYMDDEFDKLVEIQRKIFDNAKEMLNGSKV